MNCLAAAGRDAAREQGLEVVEHEHEHTPVELLVVAATSGGIASEKERRVGPFDRDVDERQHGELLRLALFGDLEVVLRQVADEVALGVGDIRVDLDVVHLDPERHAGGCCLRGRRRGRLRWRGLRWRGLRLLLGGQREGRANASATR